jgi:hypothetical protein
MQPFPMLTLGTPSPRPLGTEGCPDLLGRVEGARPRFNNNAGQELTLAVPLKPVDVVDLGVW